MKNIAIINALGLSAYALEPLSDGSTALERVLEYGAQLPEIDKLILLSDDTSLEIPELKTQPEISVSEMKNSQDLLTALTTHAAGYDHLFYFYGDCPLLDFQLTRGMYEKHIRYFAQYTFADGYPYGLTPEILKYEILAPLKVLAEKHTMPITRETLFDVLLKDINAFDVETEISTKDMRLLRVVLACDNKRNYLQTSRILEAGGKDEKSVIQVLADRPEILRTYPAYVGIQIIDTCPQACTYCPYPMMNEDVLETGDEMPLDKFSGILTQVADLAGDAVIGLSVWGEPGLHSRIEECIDRCLSYRGLSLIIETSGIGWQPGAFQRVKEICESQNRGLERIDWIVSLDALDMKLYTKLRGQGYNEALASAETLVELFPQHVYIQAVRMNENEEDLETFFRHWKDKAGNVIIQKYDYFSSFLEQRKVTDLSPLKRFPCWHIKRDLTVLLDGTVPLCREDVSGSAILGNVFSDSLETIWAAGEKEYGRHIEGNYSGICKKCDEYYTYNF